MGNASSCNASQLHEAAHAQRAATSAALRAVPHNTALMLPHDERKNITIELVVAVNNESPDAFVRGLTCTTKPRAPHHCFLPDLLRRITAYVALGPRGDEWSNAEKATASHRWEAREPPTKAWQRALDTVCMPAAQCGPLRCQKQVIELPNSWSGTEASAYLTHLALRFDDLADRIIFVHGHRVSWHASNPLCHALMLPSVHRVGGYASLNSKSEIKCFAVREDASGNLNISSPQRISPLMTLVLQVALEGWRQLVLAPPPRQLVFTCCAQFVATRAAIRLRPQATWVRLLTAAMSWKQKNKWEWLWPTLVDEHAAVSSHGEGCRHLTRPLAQRRSDFRARGQRSLRDAPTAAARLSLGPR